MMIYLETWGWEDHVRPIHSIKAVSTRFAELLHKYRAAFVSKQDSRRIGASLLVAFLASLLPKRTFALGILCFFLF